MSSRSTIPGPLRLLLVDDDEIAREVVRRLVETADVPAVVTIASDLQSGLTLFAESEFDCVLLDFILPDGTCIDFMRLAREQGLPHAPFVILTARDDESTALETVRHGAEDYLIKGRFESDLLFR